VSLRTTSRDVNAGDLLQRVLGSDHAGGHDMIAGGRIALAAGLGLERSRGPRARPIGGRGGHGPGTSSASVHLTI
jgi:hypothetical protein